MIERFTDFSPWEDSDWESPPHYAGFDDDASAPGYDTDDSWHVLRQERDNEPTTVSPQIVDEKNSEEPETGRISETSQPPCEHWAPRHCQLTDSSWQCCACSDLRPRNGVGVAEAVSRWEHYCPGCKQAHDPASEISSEEKVVLRLARGQVHDTDTHVGASAEEPTTLQEAIPTTHSSNPDNTSTSTAQREQGSLTSQPTTTRPATQAPRNNTLARALLFQATRCKHWVNRLCHLTSTQGRCCECTDARSPELTATAVYFTVYVDGKGHLGGAEQYMHYCPGCKASCEAAHGPAVRTTVKADLERLEFQRRRHLQLHQQQQQQYLGHLAVYPGSGNTGVATTVTSPYPARTPKIRRKLRQHLQQQLPRMLYTPTDPRECPHWAIYDCVLKARRCCACADNRAHAERYVKYVDGQGNVLAATRWEYYCPGCCKAGMEIAGRGDDGFRYVNWLKWKKGASEPA
ncbi:hypothetical protein Micbo1qcDRAFT_217395 [Microdochium bolleyi]|uniref:Uncharacterized protein n=1 Tax=Microdochium bolleyi TaxID=196109 RepID=A0A136JET2_9PEZI|nr:hypothetical protein Micbo1qcDRAFT_217395 [Microdochium bolleyi]